MKIKDIMTKDIITCSSEDSLSAAAKKMLEFDIGFLPVTKNKKVIGVITDRDLVIYGIANCGNECKVEKCMNKFLIAIEENYSIKDCLEVMKRHKIRRILVKKKNKLIGIVSISDIVSNYQKEKNIVNLLKSICCISRNDDHFFINVRDFEL